MKNKRTQTTLGSLPLETLRKALVALPFVDLRSAMAASRELRAAGEDPSFLSDWALSNHPLHPIAALLSLSTRIGDDVMADAVRLCLGRGASPTRCLCGHFDHQALDCGMACGSMCGNMCGTDCPHDCRLGGVDNGQLAMVPLGCEVPHRSAGHRCGDLCGRPLLLAASRGRKGAFRELLEAAAGAGRDQTLAVCARMGFRGAVKRLLELGADASHQQGRASVLCLATAKGHVGVVRALLEAGADVNARGCHEHGHHEPAILVAARSASAAAPEIVRVLIAAGADVGVTGDWCETALVYAVDRAGDDDARATIVREILRAAPDKAYVNAEDFSERTALSICRARMARGRTPGLEAVLHALIEAGASPLT